ncbi:unnamed protein product [Caenorhabditis angaria]|uniref:Tyrosine-protein phosphatase domain-containing protein n=1 Tax=Caenorhabditis angaria TaxID=860376 RepID=A0A9P1IQ73_9PELO|nr:unnamed protein product [Caenorhabditis angaria]
MTLPKNEQNKKVKHSNKRKNKRSETKKHKESDQTKHTTHLEPKDSKDKHRKKGQTTEAPAPPTVAAPTIVAPPPPAAAHSPPPADKHNNVAHAHSPPPITVAAPTTNLKPHGKEKEKDKAVEKHVEKKSKVKENHGGRGEKEHRAELSEAPLSHKDITIGNGGSMKSDKKDNEKWFGEEAALAFIDKVDSLAARTEFIEINKIQCDLQKCQIWQKNKAKNQSDKFPCYDQNIVKNANNPDDYVNATSVNIPNVTRNILIGQFPKKESSEEFWRLMFQENVMLMHILIGYDEVADFFPNLPNAYEHYGSMFVNNRRVERPDNETIKFLMEVLPTGCSNSNMINIIMHLQWNSQNVPPKFSKTVKSVIDVTNYVQVAPADEKCIILSKNGVGRAGFFLALCSCVSSLNNKIEPKVVNIVKTVREQRPFAVESFKQYTSLYLCLVYYIKKKVNDPKLNRKTREINEAFKCILEGAGTSVMPSI